METSPPASRRRPTATVPPLVNNEDVIQEPESKSGSQISMDGELTPNDVCETSPDSSKTDSTEGLLAGWRDR